MMWDEIFSDILYFVQSDIFAKAKVLLKPAVLVLFYSHKTADGNTTYAGNKTAKQYHSPAGE